MSVIKTEDAVNKKQSSKVSKLWRPYRIGFAVVFVICFLCAVFQMANGRSIIITINSASISKGQNSDGTAFDIYQILNDKVLEAAAEKLGGTITAAELKEHLSLSDALMTETNKQLKQSILDGEDQNTYFPAAYRVTYENVTDASGIGQQILGLFRVSSANRKDQILNAVAQSYQEYYEASYLTYDKMFLIDWDRMDTMDYYNRAEAVRTEAMRILRFLQDKANENPTAGSASAKLTYSDLENDLWRLISVDIENHRAYIIQNSITTSRKNLLRQFRYMEEIYKEEKERKTEEYLILDDAVDMYDSTTTKVVFIPALDQDDSFYMNRTKVGLDYLVEQADDARLAADEADHNAQYYQYLQTCFADPVTPTRSQIAHADAIYGNIRIQIEELMESTKLLLTEENVTENEGIKVSEAEMAVGILGVGMHFAKRFVILSMAAYILICFPSVFRRKKQEETQEV